MHVLITNDDGPPSAAHSPFVHGLVESLKANTDWEISVALPSSQKSWIGKAFLLADTVRATYYTPSSEVGGEGTIHQTRQSEDDWVLLDGTPATCASIGIHSLFPQKGPVDLVLSGPNFGRNSSAVFIMASGTVGGALEAALNGIPAVGISYALFRDRPHRGEHAHAASELTTKLVRKLWEEHLSPEVRSGEIDLVTVNVPLVDKLLDKVQGMKCHWTHIHQNRWSSPAFAPVAPSTTVGTSDPAASADQKEEEIREGETTTPDGNREGGEAWVFKPKFDWFKLKNEDVGSDEWALCEGMVSVTPLKACFQGMGGYKGELKL
ncbi:sure-like protein [Saitoella complicata NRRL Y-17804]|uniref:sure-like protein n=1 Tax=Saitoella complicata (strain BCRC 22490 / CBS 7301 / JCM 7358 / NBRC 10748 / NRRL Y-17804) TaxID=698492 RepID=UPI0008668CA5|nr:sure-like protein [Saitoella complicata NRRL Y-17804]ODQ49875.1 sure-like protein [Saitoella complicata NRRL Y-17804]